MGYGLIYSCTGEWVANDERRDYVVKYYLDL